VEQRLAGVICRSLSEQELKILHTELRPNNIPIVLVDSSFSHNWCSRVTSDDFTGAGMATEYLLKLGHRRIGHVTNSLNRGFSKIRYDGYIRMMSEWGIEVSQKNICVVIKEEGDILEEQRDKITAFLKQQKPTAVFCGSDPVAMKVLNIAQDIGLKIPEDLSVIGFAGLDYTACASPSLTTIKQPFTLMGYKAGEILLAETKNKITVKEKKLPVELIVRNSCSRIIL
jgi:LacI family transcriptional regulator